MYTREEIEREYGLRNLSNQADDVLRRIFAPVMSYQSFHRLMRDIRERREEGRLLTWERGTNGRAKGGRPGWHATAEYTGKKPGRKPRGKATE